MPLPMPIRGERQDAFIKRCVSDEKMNSEFPDAEQRSGVCFTQWKAMRGEKKNSLSQDKGLKSFCTQGFESFESKDAIIKGVSLITEGEALGHGMFIDKTTLEQVKECADSCEGGLRSNLNHYSGFAEIIGILKDFRLQSNAKTGLGQVIADLHLLKSSPYYDLVTEIADKMPSAIGMSIVFGGTDDVIDGKVYARCDVLHSSDLVTRPAANPSGLFEAAMRAALVDTSNNVVTQSSNSKSNMDSEKILSDIKASVQESLKPLSDRLSALETQLKAEKDRIESEQRAKELADRKESEAKARNDEIARICAEQLAKFGLSEKAPAPSEGANVDQAPKTFEELVAKHIKGGKGKVEAVKLAVKENPDLYAEAVERGISQL